MLIHLLYTHLHCILHVFHYATSHIDFLLLHSLMLELAIMLMLDSTLTACFYSLWYVRTYISAYSWSVFCCAAYILLYILLLIKPTTTTRLSSIKTHKAKAGPTASNCGPIRILLVLRQRIIFSQAIMDFLHQHSMLIAPGILLALHSSDQWLT